MLRLIRFLKLGMVLLALSFPAILTAEIYKWVDDEGNIHYGELPPQNSGAKKMRRTDTSSTDPSQAMENLRKKSDAFAERRDERKQTEDETAAVQKDKKTQAGLCTQLQKNLSILNAHTQVKVTDKDGQTKMIADKARLDKIAAVKKQIAENCK